MKHVKDSQRHKFFPKLSLLIIMMSKPALEASYSMGAIRFSSRVYSDRSLKLHLALSKEYVESELHAPYKLPWLGD
jgi:hypothetical protein